MLAGSHQVTRLPGCQVARLYSSLFCWIKCFYKELIIYDQINQLNQINYLAHTVYICVIGANQPESQKARIPVMLF